MYRILLPVENQFLVVFSTDPAALVLMSNRAELAVVVQQQNA